MSHCVETQTGGRYGEQQGSAAARAPRAGAQHSAQHVAGAAGSGLRPHGGLALGGRPAGRALFPLSQAEARGAGLARAGPFRALQRHANTALGAVLAQAGFVDDGFLDTFYGFESLFGMHPDIKVPGVEMSTGGLGHGLSVGLGMALGARLQRNGARTVVMLGDGELQEGSNWEAAMAAAHLAPLSFTAIVDYNKVPAERPCRRHAGAGAAGGQVAGLRLAGQRARRARHGSDRGCPRRAARGARQALAAYRPHGEGKGTSFAEDSYLWHNNAVSDEVYEKAMAELGGPA